MDTRELAQWMDSGAQYYDPDTSMQGGGLFDKTFGESTRGDTAPEPGTPVMGYRVMYTVETPLGKVHYGPLVKREDGYGSNNFIHMVQYARDHADDAYELAEAGILLGNIPVHQDRDGRGFYYFADKALAEEYMKVIAQGGKKVGDISGDTDTPIQLNYGELDDKGRYVGPGGNAVDLNNIKLELYRVEGVAAENPQDEGFVMQTMTIASDPDISISIAEFQEARKEIQQHPREYNLFTQYGAGAETKEGQDWQYYHRMRNRLARLTDENRRSKTAIPLLRRLAKDPDTPWYADAYRAESKRWEERLKRYWDLDKEFREWRNEQSDVYIRYLQYSGFN